jgi:hypothetical protein
MLFSTFFKYVRLSFLIFIISSYNAFTIGNLPTSINKKSQLLSISPGGLSGFYTLGITSYLKENYNLTQFNFLGASAGSWNALFLSSKIPNQILVDNLLSENLFEKSSSIPTLRTSIKNHIINTYDSSDFHLDKLYVSVSVFRFFYFKPKILQNFDSIKDAVQGCMYSSYIPFVTGGIGLPSIKTIIIDGGWPRFPPKDVHPYFTIDPSMWGKQFKRQDRFKYPSNQDFFRQMYELGYNDSRNNKHVFDLYFLPLNYSSVI